MHLQPVFRCCRMRGGSVSARLFRTGLCLPSGSGLTAAEQAAVLAAIAETPDLRADHPATERIARV
jgi:hypothetical protein